MKKMTIIYCLFLFVWNFAIADTLTLIHCFDKAIQNHPFYKNKEKYEEINELKLKNNRVGWLPTFDFNTQITYQSDVVDIDLSSLTNYVASINPNPPTSAFVTSIDIPSPSKEQYKAYLEINQVLFDGGAIKKSNMLEDVNYKIDIQQLEVDLYNIKEQVNNLYFSLLLIQRNIDLLNIIHNELTAKQTVLESGVNNGIILEISLDALIAEILKLEQQQIDLELKKEVLIKNLNLLTGENYSNETIFNFPNFEIEDSLINIRHEVEMFSFQKQKIQATQNLLKSQRMPKAFAFSQAGYGKPGLNMLSDEVDSYYIIGLGIKWNIYDWNKNTRERQILEINKDIISTKQENYNTNVQMGIDNCKADISKYISLLQKDERIIELKERITKNYASQLENGVIKTTEYLTELNAEKQAKINYELHKIQLEQAKVKYLLLLGQL